MGLARAAAAMVIISSAWEKVWPWPRLMHLDCSVGQPRERSSILIAGPDQFSQRIIRKLSNNICAPFLFHDVALEFLQTGAPQLQHFGGE